jgi:hypothetical protein
MSKLFKLSEWLTLDDAAKHLSTALGEPVKVADVYRLALDGHLTLSVNFVNGAKGKMGKIVGRSGIKWHEFSEGFPLPDELIQKNGKPIRVMESLKVDDKRYINFEDKVRTVSDVWDLMMIGAERLDVEHYYQGLTGGVDITLTCLGGVFVERNGRVCQLMESPDKNEYYPGSKAQKAMIEAYISSGKVESEKAEELREQFRIDAEILQEKSIFGWDDDMYYPAGGLPNDSVLVVRTSAIMDFLQSVNGEPAKTEKPLSTKERQTLLVLIAAMCKQARLDWKAKGVSVAIASATEEIGAPVTDDTIRKILKQIDEAVASRSK